MLWGENTLRPLGAVRKLTCADHRAAAPGGDTLIIGARAGSVARQAQQGLTVLNAGLDERVSKRTSELVRAEADRRALGQQGDQAAGRSTLLATPYPVTVPDPSQQRRRIRYASRDPIA
jgi:hypothetical protein